MAPLWRRRREAADLRAIVDQARQGDEEAFGALVREVGDRCIFIPHRILRDANLAEDAVQGALVQVWRELPGLRDTDRFAKPPSDVTVDGYSGKYLELTVPDLAVRVIGDDAAFTDCMDGGELKSWIGEPLSYAFHGYSYPGQVEEIWLLDVDGTRLMIEALWSPDSPEGDIAELRSILDSIDIVP